ncbi:uncharacterized protein [Arachis hypogaea]
MVVEESKATWVPVVAVKFVAVVDKVEDLMTVVHATAVVEWVKDCNQGGGRCRGRFGGVCASGSCYNYREASFFVDAENPEQDSDCPLPKE